MKYYLSSYKLGDETAKLQKLISQTNRQFGYIPNALDYVGADPARKAAHIESDMNDLRALGAEVVVLDLKSYFGKAAELAATLNLLSGVYVSGGNTFVLRQAYKLSGFDQYITSSQDKQDFVYIAYSAGVCLLSPDLHVYAITDDANNFPYPSITEPIWEGLNIINFAFEPHFRSDHPESASTDKEVEYCITNKILFKAYRDGEVLII